MNFINAIKNHKKKFLSVILLSGIFYNTNKILRNEKGLRKLK
jgi:hypothetical protein